MHWQGISRTYFDDKASLDFLFLLNAWRKIEPTLRLFRFFGWPDQYPVADDNELLEFIVGSKAHPYFFLVAVKGNSIPLVVIEPFICSLATEALKSISVPEK